MENVQNLESVIRASGVKKGYLAEKIGVTRQTFAKKCKDPSSFTNLQTDILCSELKITKLSDKQKIFC